MTNFEIVQRDSVQQPQTQAESGDRIVLAEAAMAGIEPLCVFTSDQQPGPVLATITASAATVWAAVDDSINVPLVRVYCTDPSSPYAQAARDTSIQHLGHQLTVTVPDARMAPRTMRGSSSAYASGPGNAYSFGSIGDMNTTSGGVTFGSVNGASFTSGGDAVGNGHQGIEVELLLPPGSGLKSDTTSGSVLVHGHLAAAKIEASSGSVTLDSVGRAEIEASTRSVRIGTVTEQLDIEASAGSVTVTHHAGHTARVRALAGSVTFTIAAEATGTVDVHSSAGSVTVYGSDRPDMTVTANTSAGSIRRP